MKNDIKQSLSLYLLLLFTIGFFYFNGNLQQYHIHIILGIVLLVIKDILIHIYDEKPQLAKKLNFQRLIQDNHDNKISIFSLFIILNRFYILPTLLIVYLMSLVMTKSSILNNITVLGESNIILITTIVSGILSIVTVKNEKQYIVQSYHKTGFLFSITVLILCSIGATYITLLQTLPLGPVSYIISILSGLLIFLVGLSMHEQENNNISYNN